MGSNLSNDNQIKIMAFFLVFLIGFNQSGSKAFSSSSSAHDLKMAPGYLLWPRGIIPYRIKGFNRFSEYSIVKGKIDAVLQEWQSVVSTNKKLQQ